MLLATETDPPSARIAPPMSPLSALAVKVLLVTVGGPAPSTFTPAPPLVAVLPFSVLPVMDSEVPEEE